MPVFITGIFFLFLVSKLTICVFASVYNVIILISITYIIFYNFS